MKFRLPNKGNMTDTEYINEVYNLYKKEIDKGYLTIANKRGGFVNQIFDRVRQERERGIKTDVKKEIRKELHRDIYISRTQKFKENLVSGLKRYNLYKKFTNSLRDEKGRFVKFNTENLTYSGNGEYTYSDDFGNVYVIKTIPSPVEFRIINPGDKK
jgi:collagenase-like PrtC family protease